MGRRPLTFVVTLVCGLGLIWGASSPISLAQHATPEAAAPPAITSEVLGRAAPVTLDTVEVGDIIVRDVPALVIPDKALSVNLLGMSFLSRVKWVHERGQLVLEQ